MKRVIILFLMVIINIYGIELNPDKTAFGLYIAPLIEKPPVIDGNLDEKVWNKGKWDNHFVSSPSPPYKFPSAKTKAKILIGKKALYAGIICEEPYMNKILTAHSGRDLWKDDCVEIFIDPALNHIQYFHLIVNAAGKYHLFISPGSIDWSPFLSENKRSNPAEVGVKKFKDRWTVEVSIPFSTLNIPPLKEGDLIGIGIGRERWGAVSGVELSFSGFGQENAWFHRVKNFGHLLAGKGDRKIYALYKEVKRLDNQADEIFKNYKKKDDLFIKYKRLKHFLGNYISPEVINCPEEFARNYLLLEKLLREFSDLIYRVKISNLLSK